MLHLLVVILPVVLKDVQVGGQVVQLDLTEALKTHKSEEKRHSEQCTVVVDKFYQWICKLS